MDMEAKYWVVESGRDCDGIHTSGQVYPFAKAKDAVAYCELSNSWSDGLAYNVIHTHKMLREYCNFYSLEAELYHYSK